MVVVLDVVVTLDVIALDVITLVATSGLEVIVIDAALALGVIFAFDGFALTDVDKLAIAVRPVCHTARPDTALKGCVTDKKNPDETIDVLKTTSCLGRGTPQDHHRPQCPPSVPSLLLDHLP